jgi:hypothetical protein
MQWYLLPVGPIEGIFDPTTNRSQTTKSTTMLKKEVLIEAQPQLHPAIGEHIGYELGAKMVKDYFDKYNECDTQFVGKNILLEILSQPDCIGIKIFKGLNEKGNMKYVFVGLNSDGKEILEITAVNPHGELSTKEGIVADKGAERLGWYDYIML